MSFLKKVQNLPELTRKIIFWILIIIISLALIFWFVNNFQKKIKNFKREELNNESEIPSLKEQFKDFSIPGTLNLEELKIEENGLEELKDETTEGQEQ